MKKRKVRRFILMTTLGGSLTFGLFGTASADNSGGGIPDVLPDCDGQTLAGVRLSCEGSRPRLVQIRNPDAKAGNLKILLCGCNTSGDDEFRRCNPNLSVPELQDLATGVCSGFDCEPPPPWQETTCTDPIKPAPQVPDTSETVPGNAWICVRRLGRRVCYSK